MPAMSSVERAFCQSAPWRAVARRVVLPWALQGARVRGDVLEVGAGSGAMAAELLATHPDITMTVTDIDPAMVSAAAAHLAPFGERATAREADATALPFPDESFDAMVSWLMLHHTVRWVQALTEAARVLRPGGMFLGYDLTGRAPLRALHRAERAEQADHRMVAVNELRRELARLPVEAVHVRRSLAVFMRFRAVRLPA